MALRTLFAEPDAGLMASDGEIQQMGNNLTASAGLFYCAFA